MCLDPDAEPIRTSRLELLVLRASFMDDIAAGDLAAAAKELGASVGRWLVRDPSHLNQLRLAGHAAAVAGFPGFARVIVLRETHRRAIGSIGFHGPPDDAGRLEVGCRIHPAHRGQGYGAEAAAALLDWATERFGIARFLVAVPSYREETNLVPVDIANPRTERPAREMDWLAELLDGQPWRP